MAEENRKGWAEREGGWRGGRGWVYQLLPSICACSLGATDVYLVPVIARCIASTCWLSGKELASRTGQPGVVARSNHSPSVARSDHSPALPGPITPSVARSNHSTSFARSNHSTSVTRSNHSPVLPGPIAPQCCPVQSLHQLFPLKSLHLLCPLKSLHQLHTRFSWGYSARRLALKGQCWFWLARCQCSVTESYRSLVCKFSVRQRVPLPQQIQA